GWHRGITEGDYEAAEPAFARALELARRFKDLALEGRILVNWAHVESHHMLWQACVEHSLAAIELAVEVRDEYVEVLGHSLAVRALLPLGELGGALAHGAAALAIAE